MIESGKSVRIPIEVSAHRLGKFERRWEFFFTDDRTLWQCGFQLAGEAVASAPKTSVNNDRASRADGRKAK